MSSRHFKSATGTFATVAEFEDYQEPKSGRFSTSTYGAGRGRPRKPPVNKLDPVACPHCGQADTVAVLRRDFISHNNVRRERFCREGCQRKFYTTQPPDQPERVVPEVARVRPEIENRYWYYHWAIVGYELRGNRWPSRKTQQLWTKIIKRVGERLNITQEDISDE